MFRFLNILCLFLCLSGFGQTTVSEKTIDFGDITSVSLRYYDVSMKNSSDKPSYILRVEQSPELVYNISSDRIYPDSTFFMRIQVNPKSKGRFNYVLRVYFSDQLTPTELRIKGNVVELPDYSQTIYTKCPDFKSTPTLLAKTNLTVILSLIHI
jgi:Ca-activated chloride channel family protein